MNRFKLLPWLILLPVLILPVIAWYQNGNSIASITIYSFFPLLGVWAWGTMWTHYVYGATRLAYPNIKKNKIYSATTELIVLICILLHPGLLAWKLAQIGKGPPPSSYYSYVASNMKVYIAIGILGLLIFLSYEGFRRLKGSPFIARYWRWISISQMLAMILIFIHSINLGQHLQTGWMQAVWVSMGALLIPCFALSLQNDRSNNTAVNGQNRDKSV